MKIGFIDYYLDEWHANMYPDWIREYSGGEMEVAYAFAEIASPITGMTTEKWCENHHIEQIFSISELTEKSDGIIVLSPDNCERHELLSRIPLMSGKPVYIDKTFAPDLAMAMRIFRLADQYHTPCYSTSALRFADEYRGIDRDDISAVNMQGPNGFETYSVHQLEPLVMLMRQPGKQVMFLPGENYYTVCVRFADGRVGTLSSAGSNTPFTAQIAHKSDMDNQSITVTSDFFIAFIKELIRFFRTREITVPHADTLRIMAIRTAVREAMKVPFTWVDVPCADESSQKG